MSDIIIGQENCLISVIVPVYNVEIYLKQCVDSILHQTYSNLQIILVDDGSTDSSGSLCDDFANMDNRIRVIHKQNEGLGYARNSGLDIATGDYVLFVDSDDYIHKDMVKRLIENLNKFSSDTSFCGYYTTYNDEKIEEHPAFYNNCSFSDTEIIDNVLLEMIGGEPSANQDTKLSMSVWHALYSLDIIKQNHIRFPSERQFISEDIIFHIAYLHHSNNVCFQSTPLYYYRLTRNGSLTYRFNENELQRQIVQYNRLNSDLAEFLPKDKYILRTQRYFLGRIRTAINKAVSYKNTNRKFKLNKYIKFIVHNSVVEDVISSYPYTKNPLMVRVFNIFLKMHFVTGLVILVKVKRLTMKNKRF